MSEEWKQERPTWCPHTDCVFKRRSMDSLCGGKLPKPVPHGEILNTHRFCIREPESSTPVYDLQVNSSDLDWFRWIFDALDGKRTSWLSKRAQVPKDDEESLPSRDPRETPLEEHKKHFAGWSQSLAKVRAAFRKSDRSISDAMNKWVGRRERS